MNFADAHVEAWHEGPSDPNATALGGAFFSEGSFTLTRSRLTAPWIVLATRFSISGVKHELGSSWRCIVFGPGYGLEVVDQ